MVNSPIPGLIWLAHAKSAIPLVYWCESYVAADLAPKGWFWGGYGWDATDKDPAGIMFHGPIPPWEWSRKPWDPATETSVAFRLVLVRVKACGLTPYIGDGVRARPYRRAGAYDA